MLGTDINDGGKGTEILESLIGDMNTALAHAHPQKTNLSMGSKWNPRTFDPHLVQSRPKSQHPREINGIPVPPDTTDTLVGPTPTHVHDLVTVTTDTDGITKKETMTTTMMITILKKNGGCSEKRRNENLTEGIMINPSGRTARLLGGMTGILLRTQV
ncbi:hypothetical protein AA313_de0203727 [Arthrobotrys entomopaga]|nr:hypothetical protein AA313_de0203727 [Arthrobotrys entomopaga]